MLTVLLLLFCSLSLPGCASRPAERLPLTEDEYARQREEMVSAQLARRDINNRRVLEVMGKVPRHLFMPVEMRQYAYIDNPVPIGHEQTISQPYIVALMTQIVAPESADRALEVGTGSGYQAAVLAELVKEVYTIEIVPELAESATQTLARLGYDNVFVRQGDGYRGWPEKAPFAIIVVTAAARQIPEPLIDQLAEGGKLVIPVGEVGGIQTLTLVTRQKGRIRKAAITDVRFVPMTGEALGKGVRD